MQNPSLDASVRKTATRAGELADVAFGICAHTADLKIIKSDDDTICCTTVTNQGFECFRRARFIRAIANKQFEPAEKYITND